MTGDEEQLTEIVIAMSRAQTAEDFIRAWAEDVTFFDVISCSTSGIERVAEEWHYHFKHIVNLRAEVLEIRAQASGDAGFVHSVQHFEADGVHGWNDIDIVFRQTDCFRKREGEWRLVHQHASLPIDFTSGMAMTKSFGVTGA